MKTLGSPAALAEAIRADAEAEVERVERELALALQALEREEGLGDEAPVDRASRLEAARREARELIAREDQEDRRDALEARETWMRSIVEEGERRIAATADPTERRERLARLAAEALRELAGARRGLVEEAEILVPAADLPLLDEAWRRGVADAAGLPPAALAVSAAESLAAGCVARTRDGRVSFDNSLAARARRLEPVWRSALADLWARR